MFRKLDSSLINRLQDIVGPENILTGEENTENYAHDETPNLSYYPEMVAKPGTGEEIAEMVTLANRERFPVVARGGGTGVTGGALPIYGGLVISLERMNRVLELDEKNMMAVVEAGIVTGDLHAAVESKGLFYPPDPASLDSCSLGGNLAEDAGGPRAVKYGVTRNYITGVRAILPTGEVLDYGGKLVKNVTGYNLLHLLIGSEGTLGIATRITVRLLSRPKLRVDLLVPFPSYFQAVHCVSELLRRRSTPTVIEFMDQKCLNISRQVLESGPPLDDAAAHLLIEVDGNNPERVEEQYSAIGEICLEEGASDVKVADSPQYQEQIWNTRRKLRECIKIASPVKISQDIVVPRMEITSLLLGIDEIENRYGIEILCYGHAGDGNVHVNFLKRDRNKKDWQKSLKKAVYEVFLLAVKLGGTISGEHGIGLTKKDYLSLALGPPAIKAMQGIKQTLDPNYILNPGKIFSLI